jgi:hypothetical protein
MVGSTQVRTPGGNRALEELKEGDMVLDEFGNPVPVTGSGPGGVALVMDILVLGKPWACCRPDSMWLVREGGHAVGLKRASGLKAGDRVLAHLEGLPFGTGFTVQTGALRKESTWKLALASRTGHYVLGSGLIARV